MVYGPHALRRLGEVVRSLGGRRALVVTGPSLARDSRLLPRVEEALEGLCVGVYADTAAHAPAETVERGARRARDAEADVLVSFGGGSPIDTAKAIAAMLCLGLERVEELEPLYMRFQFPDRREVPLLGATPMPHVAVPTTLSAAEFTGIVGVNDGGMTRKRLIIDAALTPRAAILDPVLTGATPEGLWTSSGIRAVDHAVEALYGPRRQPVTAALALAALEDLLGLLPGAGRDPEDLGARGRLQIAAAMAIWALLGSGSGLSHAIGYGLGARYGVAHGIASCVTLAHVMRFNASSAAEEMAAIARRLGLAAAGASLGEAASLAADQVASTVALLGHPGRLRDVGLRPEDLGPLADDTMQIPNVVDNARPIGSRAQLLALLEDAY